GANTAHNPVAADVLHILSGHAPSVPVMRRDDPVPAAPGTNMVVDAHYESRPVVARASAKTTLRIFLRAVHSKIYNHASPVIIVNPRGCLARQPHPQSANGFP